MEALSERQRRRLLLQALERQGAAAQAALRGVQSIVANDCPGPLAGGLSVPNIDMPCIPTLDGIVCSVQEVCCSLDFRMPISKVIWFANGTVCNQRIK